MDFQDIQTMSLLYSSSSSNSNSSNSHYNSPAPTHRTIVETSNGVSAEKLSEKYNSDLFLFERRDYVYDKNNRALKQYFVPSFIEKKMTEDSKSLTAKTVLSIAVGASIAVLSFLVALFLDPLVGVLIGILGVLTGVIVAAVLYSIYVEIDRHKFIQYESDLSIFGSLSNMSNASDLFKNYIDNTDFEHIATMIDDVVKYGYSTKALSEAETVLGAMKVDSALRKDLAKKIDVLRVERDELSNKLNKLGDEILQDALDETTLRIVAS